MFFINLYEIINSFDLTLEQNIKCYKSSFINNFIDDLKKHLIVLDNIKQLEQLPQDTLFTLDRFEGNYAVCENRITGKIYDIPKSLVEPSAKNGDILKLENGKYIVDYEETINNKKIIKELLKNVKNNI